MIFNKVVYVAAPKVQLAAPSDLIATPGTGKISLTWTDPEDIVRTGRTVATWAKTRIVRKEGAPPNDHNDGVIVVESTEKNQYQSAPYYDSTVQVGTVYHYGAFSYSEEGVWGQGAFASGSPIAGTPLGEIAEGTLIKIQENGAPVEFYLAKHSYEPDLNGAGRELLVRKDVYDQRQWNSANANAWANCVLRSWLNSNYKNLFSSAVQALMGTTTYYYTPGNGSWSVTTRGDAVFLLSGTELNGSHRNCNVDGTALPIWSTLRLAYNSSGDPSFQWTRSPVTSNTSSAWAFDTIPGFGGFGVNTEIGSRPCFTLPSTAFVDADLTLIES